MLPLVKAYYAARASVTPISFGETTKDGETRYQIAVEFQIEDHPEFAGETITWIGHFTDATAERSLESLQVAGWQGEDVSELKGVPGNEVLPDVVSLACDVDDYDGKQRLKVQWVNRPRGHFQFKQEADPGALRALGARLRATAKSVRAQGGAPRKSSSGGGSGGGYRSGGGGADHPNAPGGARDRDDIPFLTSDISMEPSPIAAVLRRF
jgi:uncharacterized membrane protein YgcG